jgi:hypothetical protein
LERAAIVFPQSRLQRIPFPDPATVLVPPCVVAKALTVLKKRGEGQAVDPRIHVLDDPEGRLQGVDAEGVPLASDTLVRDGAPVTTWRGLIDAKGRRPSGRACRDRLHYPPKQRPLGLRWQDPDAAALLRRRVYLVPPSHVHTRGSVLEAHTAEGIVFDGATPVGACRGGIIQFHAIRDLGSALIGMSPSCFAERHHILPYLAIDFAFTPDVDR